MTSSLLTTGLVLEIASVLIAWLAARRLDAGAWLVTLVLSVPLLVAAFALLVTAGGPWPLRMLAAAGIAAVPMVRPPR